MLGTIEHLARQLAVVLERRGEGGRLIQVALFRADGMVHRLEIGTGSPLRDPARMRKLFESGSPFSAMPAIRASATTWCGSPRSLPSATDPAQTGLAGPDHAEELAHLIDRLGARFGLRRVTRLIPQDTHIPEYAVAAVPAHAARHAMAAAPMVEQDTLAPARPLRLFARPEPIEAIAQVPDGPPMQFSWRHVTHQVAQVEGPNASPWNGGATTAATS